jgi:2'-5' RNA ligase
MKKVLHFIAIVIPEPLASRIRMIQEYIATHFESKAALRSPPHITLVAPFYADDAGVQRIAEVLPQVKEEHALNVRLKGFDHFGRRVVFVHVDPDPKLSGLASRLVRSLIDEGLDVKEETREYHPHVTVAFKDLTPRMYTHVWDYVQSIELEAELEIGQITLLRLHEGRWTIYEQADLR